MKRSELRKQRKDIINFIEKFHGINLKLHQKVLMKIIDKLIK